MASRSGACPSPLAPKLFTSKTARVCAGSNGSMVASTHQHSTQSLIWPPWIDWHGCSRGTRGGSRGGWLLSARLVVRGQGSISNPLDSKAFGRGQAIAYGTGGD